MMARGAPIQFEEEKRYKLIRLSDLADILSTYDDIRSTLEVFVSNPAIRRLRKLFDRVKDYAREANLSTSKLWFNEELTHEYIDIIFSPDLNKDASAVRAVFSNQHRIACVNHVFEFLKEMEILDHDAIDAMADCNDMQKLCHALQRIKKSNAHISQNEVRFILANHKAAVSIANCFIIFQFHEYTHSLISTLMKHFDSCSDVFIKNEKLVYARGPVDGYACGGDYCSGLMAALDRVTMHGVKLSVDDFIFMMKHPESVMSIAACFILLQASPTVNPQALREIIRDNYDEETAKQMARFEIAVILNSSPQSQVLDEGKNTGVVSAIWRLHQSHRVFTADTIRAIITNATYCDQLSASLALIDVRMPSTMNIEDLVKQLCRCPDKAQDLAAIMIALHENGEDCVFEFDAASVTSTKVACLRTLAADILHQIHRSGPKGLVKKSLCTLDNFNKLKENIEFIEPINILLLHLFRMRRTVHNHVVHGDDMNIISKSCLDQNSFDRVMAAATYVRNFVGLDELIDSEKYSSDELLRLLDHPHDAFLLIAAMKMLAGINVDNMPELLDQLFIHRWLALDIAKAISVEKDELSDEVVKKIIQKVCDDHPPPDLDANPIPYVLTGWGDLENGSSLTGSYSPQFFQRPSLGDSPVISRHASSEAGIARYNASSTDSY